ncbi:MAG: phosphoribosyl-AMP cyclohydrolase [Magnetococcus sp. THC-1_WYH]
MKQYPDLDTLKFNSDGLIPAISQQHDTGEILMMAWMNRDSLQETFTSGVACYWSRSRKQFWRKGETSGHVQHVKAIRTDCDRDTLLLIVDQVGVACHTGRKNCFYLEAQDNQWVEIAEPLVDPEAIYGKPSKN